MMFDGKVGDKRKVSLRGAREQKTSRDIVQEAQKARELRELDRKRNQACCLIQATIRQYLIQRHVKQQYRQGFDKKLNDIEQIKKVLASQGKHFLVPVDILATLLHTLLFFFTPAQDVSRVIKLEELLIVSVLQDPQETKLYLWGQWRLSSAELPSGLLSRMQRFLRVVFRQLQSLAQQSKNISSSSSNSCEQESQKHLYFLQQVFALSAQDVAPAAKRLVLHEHEQHATILLTAYCIESICHTCHCLATHLTIATKQMSLVLWNRFWEVVDALLQRAVLVRDLPIGSDGQENSWKQQLYETVLLQVLRWIMSIPVPSSSHGDYTAAFAMTTSSFVSKVLDRFLPLISPQLWKTLLAKLQLSDSSSNNNANAAGGVPGAGWKLSFEEKLAFVYHWTRYLRTPASGDSTAAMWLVALDSLLFSAASHRLSYWLHASEFGAAESAGDKMDVVEEDQQSRSTVGKWSLADLLPEYRAADGYKKFEFRIAVLLDQLVEMQTAQEASSSSSPQQCQGMIQHVVHAVTQAQVLLQLFQRHGGDAAPDAAVWSALVKITSSLFAHAPIRIQSTKGLHNASVLQHSSLRGVLLRSLAFNTSILTSLWRRLQLTQYAELVSILLQCDDKMFYAHSKVLAYCHPDKDPRAVHVELLQTMHVFATLFQYHMNAIDDEDLLSAERIFSKATLCDIVVFLKQWLYRGYVLQPLFAPGNNPHGSHSTHFLHVSLAEQEHPELYLLQHHCLMATTALFQALCSRHDRRPFLSPAQYQWPNSVISAQDLQLQPTTDASSPSQPEGVPHIADDDEEEEHGGVFTVKKPSLQHVLTFIPQVIPFALRMALLHDLLERDHAAHNPPHHFHAMAPPEHITIHRTHLVEDAIAHIYPLPAHRWKGRIQVTFVSEQGHTEAGIDGGGLFKEFIDSFAKAVCTPEFGLFAVTSQQMLSPHPSSYMLGEGHLQLFEMLGKMVGKAVYERILFESELAPGFLNLILGRSNQVDDLFHLDDVLYRSLMDMKRRAGQGEDVASYGLHFEASREEYGHVVTEEIKPQGSELLVTNDNLREYIILLAHFKQNVLIRPQCQAFVKGLRALLPIDWLRMFNVNELQLIVGGDQKRIDLPDMRKHVVYHGGYYDTHPYIQSFWKVVEEMSLDDQRHLLKFITSCSRQPLLGFSQLTPKLGIQKVNLQDYEVSTRTAMAASGRLPSSATCMNLLKLPQYASEEILRDKLLYAIRSKSGFELS